jgi:hypothetical protein
MVWVIKVRNYCRTQLEIIIGSSNQAEIKAIGLSDPAPGVQPNRTKGYVLLRRIARIMWWTPIVCLPIAFIAIQQFVPDLNRNSIGDGFRKLNVFFGVIGPLAVTCWGIAFAITAYLDFWLISNRRLRYWGLVFLLLVLLVLALCYIES